MIKDVNENGTFNRATMLPENAIIMARGTVIEWIAHNFESEIS